MFNHLGILPIATKKIKVFQKSELLKKNQILPPFLDKITTLNFAFKFCLDICCIPKKVLIRVLAKYTKDDKERNYLEKLCCKERPDLYTKIILDGRKTFLDLLLMFQTCCPPVVRLIENLPKLFPRPYSIASSPLASPNKIRIVFSVIEIANDDPKEGLCTGMLKKLINNKKDEKKCTVKYFFRKCNGFNLPDTDVPIILIGTGTGIAPYLGEKKENRNYFVLHY